MSVLHLTNGQARRFMLAHQGLFPPRSLRGKEGLMEHFQRVRSVQFDPINVTGRNHEIVLQARVEDYSGAMLHDLLYGERKLLDGFDKCLCVYSLEDWPCFRRDREAARRRLESRSHPVIEAATAVRKEIEERGPLSSADLQMEQPVRWPWGPTRLARAVLEGMYFWGELVVHHKVGARKFYDLSERHIPREILDADEPNPTDDEYHDWHVLRRVGSTGLLCNRGGEVWLGLLGTSAARRAESLRRLCDKGKLMELKVDGLSRPAYMRSEDMPLLEQVAHRGQEGETGEKRAAVLAPLDNLLWDRRTARELFGFEYTWEVYVPAGKRVYGYYVLPILYGDRFVARFEPLRDRKPKRMIVKNWWWERDGFAEDPRTGTGRVTTETHSAIVHCLDSFRRFLECDSIEVEDGPARPAMEGILRRM